MTDTTLTDLAESYRKKAIYFEARAELYRERTAQYDRLTAHYRQEAEETTARAAAHRDRYLRHCRDVAVEHERAAARYVELAGRAEQAVLSGAPPRNDVEHYLETAKGYRAIADHYRGLAYPGLADSSFKELRDEKAKHTGDAS